MTATLRPLVCRVPPGVEGHHLGNLTLDILQGGCLVRGLESLGYKHYATRLYSPRRDHPGQQVEAALASFVRLHLWKVSRVRCLEVCDLGVFLGLEFQSACGAEFAGRGMFGSWLGLLSPLLPVLPGQRSAALGHNHCRSLS